MTYRELIVQLLDQDLNLPAVLDIEGTAFNVDGLKRERYGRNPVRLTIDGSDEQIAAAVNAKIEE